MLRLDTLVDLLRDASARFGSSTALSIAQGVRQRRWTYNQLWESSGKVSALLAQRGLCKGDRAIIWSHNCPEWVTAFFGCLRAGVVAIPLDVRSAPDFVNRVVEQTEPKIVFLSRQTSQVLEISGLPALQIEDLEDTVEGMATPEAEPSIEAGDIVELMYTSGTTGAPKGVVLTHRNVVSNVIATSAMVSIRPSYRLLSLLPLSHMLEQTAGLLIPLHHGASVVYAVSRQPNIIFKTMRVNRVTNAALVPQALQLFMNAIEREVMAQGKERQWRLLLRVASALPIWARRLLFRPVHRRMGGGIAFMMSGGAYLDPELSRKWALLGIPVLQGYGATETSPIITTDSFGHQRRGSVGRVLPGQQVRIAVDGEILTRGPNVTQGYWQDPEATAAAFEDGWYKTGDLGYVDDQGYLYLKGRKKDLIVLPNGQNVYPEDIENVIRNQPGVRDGVVVGLPSNGGDATVHAVFLLESGCQAADVVRAANQLLAGHQQIQGFTVWPEDDFPRTHTLKVKKPLVLDFLLGQAREPEPEASAEGAAPQTAPISELQRILSSVCSLPPETLTPDKSLGLDLNLDSLGRVELLSAIEEGLGVYVDEEQLSPATTLQELEALVQAGGGEQTLPFPAWGRSLWCGVLRVLLQSGVIFPFLRIFYKVRVTGLERLDGLEAPLLFAANHNVKMDNPFILMALPPRWRRRLCPAAAADFILGNPLRRIGGPLLGNSFPFSREGSIRTSLEHLGQLLDWGWSVLIYPEGRSNRDGMESFKAGAGLVAVESHTPVVPIRVVLHKGGVFDGAGLLSRGDVEIRFGQPIKYPRREDYRVATEQLEAAVRAL